ncbi:MAG: NDP-sugar synthase [Desulfomonilaceae bacterium]
MKAMILAAGLGTRLRPLTLERAKPAIPLLGKPLIIRLIEKLMQQGATDFRLNLHHLPHTIENLFQSPPWDSLPVSFSHEPRILGTAGGLKANEAFFDQGTFLMVNGDIVLEFSLEEAIAFHRDRKALATLVLYPQQEPYRHSPIRVDDEGHFRHFKGIWPGNTPRAGTYVFTGVHILEPEIFRFVPKGEFYEINDQVYTDGLQKGEKIYGFPVEGYWNDLGTPRRYLDAQKAMFQRGATTPPVHISPGASLADNVALGLHVSVGSGCVLEQDSFLENSILWDNVCVRDRATIRDSIVGANMIVEGDCNGKILTRNGEAAIV